MQAVIPPPPAATGTSQPVLVLSATSEHRKGIEYRLPHDSTVIIGTAQQCGLLLAGDNVSAMHCSLRWDDLGIWLENWSSGDGTFLDDELITAEMPVNPQSTIRLGDYSIRLRLDGCPAVPAGTVDGDSDQGASPSDPLPEPSQLPSPANRPALPKDDEPQRETPARRSTLAVTYAPDSSQIDLGPWDQETFDMLRAEIEHLRIEVAERDAQVAEALAAEPETPLAGVSVTQLTERLEALLDELDRSDERMSTLEQLLQVTEEANRDEREERRQMESWLGDIEAVFAEHLATWEAEMNELRSQSAAVAAERDQLLQQLSQPAETDDTAQESEDARKLRLQITHLQQKVADGKSAETRLQEELQRRDEKLAEAADLEHSLREDHLKLAAERASLSRLRAEITSEQADHQKRSHDAQVGTDIDSRVRGFREHLREMSDEETQEDDAPSLSGRIARLWKRMDGHR